MGVQKSVGLKKLSEEVGYSTTVLIENLRRNLANHWSMEDALKEVGLDGQVYELSYRCQGRYNRISLVRKV
jgi:hypothetical protein